MRGGWLDAFAPRGLLTTPASGYRMKMMGVGILRVGIRPRKDIKMRKSALLLLITICLGSIGFCAEEPAISKPVSSIVAIFTKSDDVDERKIQDDMLAAFSSRLRDLAGASALDLKSSLPAGIKDDQLKRLMTFPELVGQTDRVRRNIHADGLLIARIEAFGKAGKKYVASLDLTYYDLRGGSAREIEVGGVDYKNEMDKKAFVMATADEVVRQLQRTVPDIRSATQVAIQEKSVVCNKTSRLFHAADCHHPPAPGNAENLSRADAVAAEYRPCLVCYPEVRRRINPEGLEAILGSETAGFIEYYYRVSNNPADHARIERIGRKIVEDNGFTKRNYTFTALNSEEINAIAAPGGSIYVTTGLLEAVESDDELACVLGHEIAHDEQEHGVKQYRRAQNAQTLGILASILTGVDFTLLSDFAREFVLRGYDRRYESEADRYGYVYVRRTTFNPEADFTILGKLQDMELASNWKVVSWLRTHPKADDRIKSIEDYKTKSQSASEYMLGLSQVDAGLASAVRTDELKYVDSVDQLKSYVEAVKSLP